MCQGPRLIGLLFVLVRQTEGGQPELEDARIERDASIDQFLRPLIRSEAKKGGNADRWEATGNGGYLLRFRMDVTGDGQDEVFLSSSLSSSGYHAEWEVLSVDREGHPRPYRTRLTFAPGDVFRRIEGSQTELVYNAPPDMELQRGLPREKLQRAVHRHVFNFPKIESDVVMMNSSEVAMFKEGVTITLPQLEAVLLSDYLKGGQVSWREVAEWKVDSNNYFRIPTDAGRLNKDSQFTPQAALNRLEATGKVNASSRKQSEEGARRPLEAKNMREAENSKTT